MVAITKLSVTAARNIETMSFSPTSGLNLLYGINGSGKTSILESIHALATGRSFRSSKLDTLIAHNAEQAVVFAELSSGQKAGFSKSLKVAPELKLDGDRLRNWESVARVLPVLILDSNAFQLIEGGPRIRRAFMDWGVFHVEPKFIRSWRDAKKCVAQRNLLLKKKKPDKSLISAWSAELCQCSFTVDAFRSSYIAQFEPVFEQVYSTLAPEMAEKVSIRYLRGWDVDRNLEEVLDECLETDYRYGATQSGPHRAEVLVKIDQEKAADVLSRGQLKVLVMAMRIAQGQLLSAETQRTCTYLVDDLAAELDAANRAAVLKLLIGLNGQVFVTAVHREDIEDSLPDDASQATFHVERGTIRT